MAAPAQCPYRIYRVSGRPIFAAPLRPRGLRRAGVSRYQPVTPKRAAFRSLVSLSMMARADWLLGTTAVDPVGAAGFDFHGWMDELRRQLQAPGATGVVFWPPQRDRGRIYVHLFDGALKPIGFAKVAFDQHNADRLGREAQTLRDLDRLGLRTCRVPRILATGAHQGAYHLVLEPLPSSARPLEAHAEFPARCVAEFAGAPRRVPREELGELSWWSAHQAQVNSGGGGGGFDRELPGLIEVGVTVRRAHGDFGPSNIVRDGDQLWIFDWEESVPDAPVLADEVMFSFSMDLRLARDPRRCLKLLHERFLRGAGPQRRAEVMLALAFRRALGMQESTRIIDCWEQAR